MKIETSTQEIQPTKLYNYLSRQTLFAAFALLATPIFAWAHAGPAPVDGSNLKQVTVSTVFLENIKKIYRAKCGPQYIGCFLTEADLDERGSANQVLIFRGENRAFNSPVTSSLYRWLSLTPDLSKAFNDVETLSKTIYSFMRNDLGPKNQFDSQARIFDSAASAPRAKFRVLSSNHLSLEGLKIVNSGSDQKFVFDPFVSFSLNPLVSLGYTGISGTSGPAADARLYIGSVPKEKFVALKGSQCDQDVPLDPLYIYDINKCAHGDDASDSEGERDAAFYLPVQYLRWVVKFDR